MITREADYGLRTILFLSSKWPDGFPVAANVLAEEMDIPYRFLRRIVTKLAVAGFISSERGRNGGICLARPPADISLLEVLASIDRKSICLNMCLSDQENAGCDRHMTCPVHREMGALQKHMIQKLDDIKFSALISADSPAGC
ncbi:MAG: Rrf2 family transcriptional regulator [Lentisphaeria bacterium]|nr:Rrf2 family transcriptional regulator [Lentisphaeria bacterium]